MRKVELVKGISSSALGFGCAPILGSVGRKAASRAIEVALDCGITHFDLARSYGYGEAEAFVGNLLKQRRSEVVLASKFGIKANWKAQFFKPIKPAVRSALKALKKKDTKVEGGQSLSVADRFHDRIPLRGVEMRKSLEKSLRVLNTDYLDYFFVHEPREALIYFDELEEMATLLKKEGKIRAWGLAYMRSQEMMHQAYLHKFDLLQFDNSPGAMGYEQKVQERGENSNIIFSPLKGGSTLLSPNEKLAKLFQDFPKSVILCSMFNERHLRANCL
ncbi:MAG: aldo/keto reductase, partial [Runella zeae]